MNSPYLTVREVEEALSLCNKAVLRLINSGALVSSDISLRPGTGRPRWRILQTSLDDFLRDRTHQPATKRRRRRRRDSDVIQFFK